MQMRSLLASVSGQLFFKRHSFLEHFLFSKNSLLKKNETHSTPSLASNTFLSFPLSRNFWISLMYSEFFYVFNFFDCKNLVVDCGKNVYHEIAS